MSLQVNTFNTAHTRVYPIAPPSRAFVISPAIYGSNYWSIDQSNAINVSSSGQWTITPTSNFTASIKMWGAGGCARTLAEMKGSRIITGGAGGYSYGTMSFVKDTSYVMVVGQHGVTGVQSYTTGGGGYGRTSVVGQGGGLSGLFIGSYTHGNSVLIAGGGAGAGGNSSYGNGGTCMSPAGGGLSGQNNSTDAQQGGGSGSQSSGGVPSTYNNATSGSALAGGLGSYGGASNYGGNSGGGGGYYGGGGANVGVPGAGSGFVHSTIISNGGTITGNYFTPANSSDAQRGQSGRGGSGSIASTDGRIIIS